MLDDATSDSAAASGSMKTMSIMDESGPPALPGSGDGTNDAFTANGLISGIPVNTNLLWIQASNFWGGIFYGALNQATDEVYAICSTTNLLVPFSLSQVETEVFPTSTNGNPFAVVAAGRPTLFLRAQDWTGVTHNGNQTPDWWFWEYFGTTDLSDNNPDSSGNTLVSDYWGGTDPNIILFTIVATNNYLNNANAPLQLNVTAGEPAYVATIVNSTNLAGATWLPYTSSNLVANLGGTQGWQSLWVGLRGRAPNATQTWQWKRLNVSGPPVLAITSPAGSVLNMPLAQIYGYSQEPLAGINYGVSNALGMAVNLPAELIDQYYDTNAAHFTTNCFECLDVPLTNGLNVITLTATDLAGDTTVTNFNFTVDYSTKTAPVVQMTWPLDGMAIAGNSVTLRGQVDDPTVSVEATVTGTNGNTATVGGVVERTGRFWVENVPLNSGPNTVSITLNNIINQSTVTNLTLAQSPLTLTINPPTDVSLWGLSVTVSGTISDSSQAVYVNGVAATVTPDGGDSGGTWMATNVPTTAGGVASFYAATYPPGQGPSGNPMDSMANLQPPPSAGATADVDKPWRLYVSSYVEAASGTYSGYNDETYYGSSAYLDDSYVGTISEDLNYNDNQPNSASCYQTIYFETADFRPDSIPSLVVETEQIADTISISGGAAPDFSSAPMTKTEIQINSYCIQGQNGADAPFTNMDVETGFPIVSEFCDIGTPMVNYSDSYRINEWPENFYQGNYAQTYHRSAQVKWKTDTGGKAIPGVRSLFVVSGEASGWSPVLGNIGAAPNSYYGYFGTIGAYFMPFGSPVQPPFSGLLAVGPEQAVSVGSMGAVGPNGVLYASLPNGVTVDSTPNAGGGDADLLSVNEQKYRLFAITNGVVIDLSANAPEFCAGQQVVLSNSFAPPLSAGVPVSYQWNIQGKYVNQITNLNMFGESPIYTNNPVLTTNRATSLWWYNGGANLQVSCTCTVGKATATAQGSVNIYRPKLSGFTCRSPRGFIADTNFNILSYGDPNSGASNLTWEATINSTYNGLKGVTQIITADWWTEPFPGQTSYHGCADAAEFYEALTAYYVPNPPSQSVELDDAPQATIGSYSGEISFTNTMDYVRFKPGTCENDGSIFVTLGTVLWNAHGRYNNLTSTMTVNYTPAATLLDNSDVFPVWNCVKEE